MGKKAGKGHNSQLNLISETLRSVVERIERLEEQKANIAEDIKDVYAEAKGNGLDTKTIRQIIRLGNMTDAEREEHEALLDIYKASLCMLAGTPLGDAAIKRLTQQQKKEEPETTENEPAENKEEENISTEPVDPSPTIEEAREMAKKAAEEGKPVTSNPFPALDPRRAAWDESWCKHAGSDGMDLPDAWRRKPKKPEDKGDE